MRGGIRFTFLCAGGSDEDLDKDRSCGAGAGFEGHAEVLSATGKVGLSARAMGTSPSPAGAGGHAGGYLSFSDLVRIGNPSLTGEGTLTFVLYLERSVTLDAVVGPEGSTVGATAWVDAQVHIAQQLRRVTQVDSIIRRQSNAGVQTERSSSGTINDGTGGDQPVPNALGYHTFSVPFRFNEEFGFALELCGDTCAGTSFGGSAAAGLYAKSSLGWGGIKQVSVDGAPVEYTLWSQSGIDWTRSCAPVPEPATAWLLIAALPALAWGVRRRRV